MPSLPRFGVNPIIVKELRSRMRGARAFLILTVMLLFLGGATYGIYHVMLRSSGYGSTLLSPVLGQSLFIGLALLELVIICFVTPAVTAGAVSSEREKLTYEMLLTTPLAPSSILWGKLIAALSYVLLLIFAAIPMASLVFIFGGVAPRQLLMALVMLVTITIMLGVVSIFLSVWLGRTGRATIMSYLFVLLLVLVPIVAYIATGIVRQAPPPRWILIPNPVSALFSAIVPNVPSQGMSGIFQGLAMALSGNLDLMTGMDSGTIRPLYHYSLPIYAAVTLICYLLAAQLIKPVRRWRPSLATIGLAAALILALTGGTAVAFFSTAGQYELASIPPTPAPGIFAPAPVMVERAVRVAPPAAPIPTEAPIASNEPLTHMDEAAIYAAVVDGLLTMMPPEGEDRELTLSRQTDDVVGYADVSRAASVALPAAVQEELATALDDTMQWIDTWPPDGAAPEPQGTAIVFGQIHPLADGTFLVAGTAYENGRRRGASFVIARDNEGGWSWAGETRAVWDD